MSTKFRHLISKSCGLVLFAFAGDSLRYGRCCLQRASTAQCDRAGIQHRLQRRHLRSLGRRSVPGRPDGYFVVPNNGKQALQLDILLNALRQGIRVTMSHDPATCTVSTVGTCANNSPC